MKPLLPPVVMALVRCPIVDYFTIVPICRYPEQLSGRATPTLPSWIPPAYLLYTVSLSYALEPARMLRTIFVIDTLLSPTFVFFFSLFCILIFFFFFILLKKRRKSEQKDSTTNTMSVFVAETILASKTLQTLRKFSVIKLRYSHRQTVAIYANSHFSEHKLKK